MAAVVGIISGRDVSIHTRRENYYYYYYNNNNCKPHMYEYNTMN